MVEVVEKIQIGDKVVKIGDKLIFEVRKITRVCDGVYFDFDTGHCERFFNKNISTLTIAPETTQEAYDAGFVKGYEEAKKEFEKAVETAIKNISHNGDTYTATAHFHGAHIPTNQKDD